MAEKVGPVPGRPAVGVSPSCVGAQAQQRVDRVRIPIDARQVQSGHLARVLCVHVGTALHQRRHDAPVAAGGRHHQGCPPSGRLGARVGPVR